MDPEISSIEVWYLFAQSIVRIYNTRRYRMWKNITYGSHLTGE